MTAIREMYNELQTLIAEHSAAEADADAARARLKGIAPDVPKEARATPAELAALDPSLDSSWFSIRQTIPAHDWRAMLAEPPGPAWSESALARLRIGLAAAEFYEAAYAEATRTSGYDAAEAASKAAGDRVFALQKAIGEATPATLDDVRLQAMVGIAADDPSIDEYPVVARLMASLASLPATA